MNNEKRTRTRLQKFFNICKSICLFIFIPNSEICKPSTPFLLNRNPFLLNVLGDYIERTPLWETEIGIMLNVLGGSC